MAAGTRLLIYLSRVRVPEGALKVLVLQKKAAGLVLFSCIYGDFRGSRRGRTGRKTRPGRGLSDRAGGDFLDMFSGCAKARIQVGYTVFGGYNLMGEMLIAFGGLNAFMPHENAQIVHVGLSGLVYMVNTVIGGEIVPELVGGQRKGKLFFQPVHEEPDGISGKGISTAVKEHRTGGGPGAQFQIGIKLGEGKPAQGNHPVFGTFSGDFHHHTFPVNVPVFQAADLTLAKTGVKHQGNHRTVPGRNPGHGRTDQGEYLPDFTVTVDMDILLG